MHSKSITILDLIQVGNILIYQAFNTYSDVNEAIIEVQQIQSFIESIISNTNFDGSNR